MRVAVRLTSVEFRTPSVGLDAARLAGLGFLRAEGTEEAVVLRTCADPYGCRVVLRSGARAGVARLLWRPADAEALAGSARHGGHLEHAGTTVSELRWEQDRQWSAGPALSCPLHPGGSTELCVVDPPFIATVRGPDLGADALTRFVPQGGPRVESGPAGLRLQTGRAAGSSVQRTPGGLLVVLEPEVGSRTNTLESESVI